MIKNEWKIERVIYPGSYVHVSPSFIFSDVVYIDSDKKAKKFFEINEVKDFICERKEYPGDPKFSFYGIDYKQTIDDFYQQFDLLVSQYAGFISDSCKDYLKIGGILLVNNSHGDAGLASIDQDYGLIATVHKTKGKYRISTASLDKYFIPKSINIVTKELLYKTNRGVGYTKTAPLYIFRRIS